MRYLSVCSGIEAASVAWEKLGWKPVAFSEIEPFPSAVLKHHWPEVPNLGDMSKYEDWKLGTIDLLVGGTPCQAFSVAGLRKGLDDPRGGLTLTFVRIADHFNPNWIVWENVPGVFTSKDNGFGCFLGALAGEDGELQPPGGKWKDAGCVFGPKRSIAWRCLDAQYFGVAQRRKRCFLVACPRDYGDPTKVLFEWASLRRDSAPSRSAGKETSTHASGSPRDGGQSSDSVAENYWTNPESPCDTLLARDYKGIGNQDLTTGRLLVKSAIPIHDQATRHAGKRGEKQDGKGNG
ncbi:MAG: DNA cytosine methyltransferase, partial [Verrucomicrobia bacterium]|nr:DNA cytosine methyltransferase [Verrucomicrobiota bacterium]